MGRFRPVSKELQTAALPLGYVAMTWHWSGRRDLNPRPPPWQGGVLPLNYFRTDGAETQNRTGDTWIFSPLLYRLSYLGMAESTGFEPAISGLTGQCVKPSYTTTPNTLLFLIANQIQL